MIQIRSSDYHLKQAEDVVSRSWERWGEPNHVEIGALCSDAHLILAETVRKSLTNKREEYIEKAEELLDNAWEHHYNIKDSYKKALAYARLAKNS